MLSCRICNIECLILADIGDPDIDNAHTNVTLFLLAHVGKIMHAGYVLRTRILLSRPSKFYRPITMRHETILLIRLHFNKFIASPSPWSKASYSPSNDRANSFARSCVVMSVAPHQSPNVNKAWTAPVTCFGAPTIPP